MEVNNFCVKEYFKLTFIESCKLFLDFCFGNTYFFMNDFFITFNGLES